MRSLDLFLYTARKGDNVKSHVRNIVGQESTEVLDEVFEGVDCVIHIASSIDIRPIPSPLLERVNVHGTKNVVAACQRTGVRALVYTSSIEVISGCDAAGKRQDSGIFAEACPVAHKCILPYGSINAQAEGIVIGANKSSGLGDTPGDHNR